jgi:tetratricopeptide (TPR) repeat protein
VLGLVQVWGYIVAARYSYLPGVSLALLAGGGTYRLLRGDEDARAARTESAVVRVRRAPILAPAVIAAALVALAAVTASDTRAWRNGETLWRRALAIDPRNHLAHTNLGGFYALQGKPSEAESEFRRALETDPRLGDALGGLATLALEAGRLDEAEALYERALASQPVHPSVVSNLGVLHMKRGESARAIAAFEQAIAMHPTYADAWRNLGGALEATGDHARAAEALRAAVRLNPEDDDARRLLAASLFRADRRAEALDAARANLERDPRDVYSANIAAWVLATAPESELRDGAEAVRIAAAALQNEADPPAYLLDTYAAALATAGRFEEAVAAARRAVERAVAVGDSAQARLSRERLARFTAREAFRDEATPRAGG